MRTELRRAYTRLKPVRWNMSWNDSRLRVSIATIRTSVDPYTQSGGDIEASMASACLGNLEVLSKNGVDMEVICNTVGIVYAGRFGFDS